MNPIDNTNRIKALAERSSYIENVLRHSLIASLSSVLWVRDPMASLEVFNSEVDSAGFDVVISLNQQVRYVQLKQAHAGKVPANCSVRLSFSEMPGSCVILMSHSIENLNLTQFRFFGGKPSEPMISLDSMKVSKAPGRRNAVGERKVRTNYRDIPTRRFDGPLNIESLFEALFPSKNEK